MLRLVIIPPVPLLVSHVAADLNGLADEGICYGTGANAVIDNTLGLYTWINILCELTTIAPTGDAHIPITLLRSTDAVTFESPYPATTSATPGAKTYPISVTLGSGEKTGWAEQIRLEACYYRLHFNNRLGVSIPSGARNKLHYELKTFDHQ